LGKKKKQEDDEEEFNEPEEEVIIEPDIDPSEFIPSTKGSTPDGPRYSVQVSIADSHYRQFFETEVKRDAELKCEMKAKAEELECIVVDRKDRISPCFRVKPEKTVKTEEVVKEKEEIPAKRRRLTVKRKQ
jgi:hypothetical protein